MALAARVRRVSLAASLGLMLAGPAIGQPAVGVNPPAAVKAWSDIAKLPDWSGSWMPSLQVEYSEFDKNPLPWNAKAQAQIDFLKKESDAGRPKLILWGCFPHGMPGFMIINHNFIEFLFTPGRVTMLGEVDGNRLRRIHTDGRQHPADPDPTFHGHSIGHWEGDTLVIDTVGISPQVMLAPSETVGIPNNGDMHIVERIRLRSQDVMENTITITAPKVLTKSWTSTRTYSRRPGPENSIAEAQCVRGNYTEGLDKDGNATFIPAELTPGAAGTS